MTPKELIVLLTENVVGRVVQERGRLRFVYESAWRVASSAIPLSLSMPLASSDHGHDAIHAFMSGLLPDNEQVLARWGQLFQVSASNPFALLSNVGEDCAGAVQFVRAERLNDVLSGSNSDVEWLTESEIAQRLRTLRADHSQGRLLRDHGQFSLAGAQAKTALTFQHQRWGVPSGRTPTTHILKPPIAALPGHVENEHLCLSLARELGFAAARSQVQNFEDEQVIVVERFDRYRTADLAAGAAAEAAAAHRPIHRLHQEDLCQALGLSPTLKYQNEGGPTPRAVVDLLRTHSARPVEDVTSFVGALIFNWLIAGTDGHAKNYSLLFGARAQVRLAPLYDLGSALPYPDIDQRRLKLAMKVGDTYVVRNIGARDIEQLATTLALEPKVVLSHARELAARLPAAIAAVSEAAKAAGLSEPKIDRLAKALTLHAARCAKAL